MINTTVRQQKLLHTVQDRTTTLRRWLDTENNSATLTAHLRDERVDQAWLIKYQRLTRDLLSAVGSARAHAGSE
jgi:hypothetical protein